jgi:hypothetical protein
MAPILARQPAVPFPLSIPSHPKLVSDFFFKKINGDRFTINDLSTAEEQVHKIVDTKVKQKHHASSMCDSDSEISDSQTSQKLMTQPEVRI